MATSPFKAFIPFTCNYAVAPNLPDHRVVDPSPSTWRSIGLTSVIPGEDDLRVNVEVGNLLMVQINERILPGKVRDEELKKRVAKLEAAEGRKVSKKEYAELRDQTEFDLLPRAFIRRSNIPVFFCKHSRMGAQWMLVFTSSAKKAGDVVAFLESVFDDGWLPMPVSTQGSVQSVLTQIVTGDHYGTQEDQWSPGRSAMLKASDKRTVRVKDAAVSSERILGLIKDGYEVTELQIDHGDESQHTFIVNTNLTFKRVDPGHIKDTGDFYADATLRLAHIKALLGEFFRSPEDGGVIEMVASTAATDDEEL
jgi:recombination associated protein RdgC